MKQNIFQIIFIIFIIACFYFVFHSQFYDDVFFDFKIGMDNKNEEQFPEESISNFSLSDDFSCPDCNVILITLPNLMASHLGSYGYKRDTSPNIDKMVEKSIIFKNAFTVSSWTTPAAASLLTSWYPYAHNVMRWHDEAIPLSENIPSLPKILKEEGYTTAFLNGGADYDKIYNFNEGFDYYFQGNHFSGYEESMAPAIDWINKNKNKKFFLFLQSFNVHCPYYPPEPFRSRYGSEYKDSSIGFNSCFYSFFEQEPEIINEEKFYTVFSSLPPRDTIDLKKDDDGPTFSNIKISEKDLGYLTDLYDGNINYTDKLLGEFFDELEKMNLLENTIIIFTSEHGELLEKNGRISRGAIIKGNFYDDVVHIPLVIKNPKIKKLTEVEGLVSIVDIMPTLLDFLKINFKNKNFQGKNLNSLIFTGEKINNYIYGGTEFFSSFPSNIDMIRSEKIKLIREKNNETGDISYELYDLKNDPKENRNIFSENLKLTNFLDKKINDWIKNISIKNDKWEKQELPNNLIQEIKFHGYQQ